MRDAADKITSYIQGYTFKQFVADDKTFDAVIRELSVIGEAANRVSKDFQQKHHEIPWSDINGMRNQIIHDYLGIDLEIIWNTCTKSLPELNPILERLLDDN